MSSNLLGEVVANNGTYIVNNTTEVTKTIDAIIVLEDSVFASIKTAGTESKTTYIASTATAVKAGAIITPVSDLQFSGVQLVSGSVALVLG